MRGIGGKGGAVKKGVEDVMDVLRGNWEDLPPDAPTCVRFYLCAQEDGEWGRGRGGE